MSINFPGSPHTMGFLGFSKESISQAFPIRWVFLSFTVLWETYEKIRAFLIWWSTPQDWNLIEKPPILWKSIGTNFPGLPHSMGFVDFCNTMGSLMRKHMHFPCDEVYHKMEKKRLYYRKSLSINFSDFPHTMGFVAFSRAVGNWWENQCIPIWWHWLIFSNVSIFPWLTA